MVVTRLTRVALSHAASALVFAATTLACPRTRLLPAPLIAGDTAPVTVVPFELFDARINVSVTVRGESAWLILDSGAGRTLLDRGWVRHLRVPELWDSSHALVDTMRLGSLTLRHFGVALGNMRGVSEAAGRFEAGIIGQDFLEQFTVELDYRERFVRLYHPGTYVYAGTGVVLPFADRYGYPVILSPIQLTHADSATARLLLDTGNGSLCVILFTPFVNRYGLASALEPTVDGPLVTGLAGPLHVAIGSLPGLRLGTLQLDSVPTGLGREEKSFLAGTRFDGILGGRLFQGGRVIIDYARRQAIVEPGAVQGRDCSYDHSGLVLRAQSPDYRRFKVAFVVPGSPAAAGGIQSGDELLTIDGRPTAELDLPDIRSALATDGVIRRIRIARGADTILVTLPLRRLF